MHVILFNFAKARNSTAVIDDTSGTTVSGQMYTPCDMLTPVIKFKFSTEAPRANYAYITEFHRYYFIESWEFESPFWVAKMSVDALATYRDTIGDSNQYILRAETNNNRDTNIIDTKYPATARPYVYTKINTAATFAGTVKGGTYVVGIFNSDQNSIGCVSYYAFTNTNFRTFANFLMSDEFMALVNVSASEISSNLLKAVFNPMQYIASCMWFPFSDITTYGTVVSKIPFGFWAVTANATRLNNATHRNFEEFTEVPKHPQRSNRGNYLQCKPYSTYKMIFNPFGMYEIPNEIFYSSNYLGIAWDVDLITGAGTMSFWGFDSNQDEIKQFAAYPVQVGVPVTISQSTGNIGSAAGSLLSTAGNLLAGNALGAAAGIADFATSVTSANITAKCDNGNIGAYNNAIYLVATFYGVVNPGNAVIGTPVCSFDKISTHPGFIICENPKITIAATPTEIDTIERAMAEGFYYE